MGEVKIGFSAVGPNFLGALDGEVYVRGNPAAPAFLQFGAGKPISLRGDVVLAENADADGNDLEVMYWGRRRGLHYALVKVGETPDLDGTSAAIYTFPSKSVRQAGNSYQIEFENERVLLEFLTGAGIDTYDPGNDPSCSQSGGRMTDVTCTGRFGNFLDVLAALRPNPYNEDSGKGYVYRDKNGNLIRLTSRKPRARPEPRESAGWTMADYHALCNRASGLSGGNWRAPSIGEAAALAHQHVSVIVGGSHNKLTQLWTLTNDVSTPITLNALTVNADTVPLLRREFPIGIPGLVPSQLSPPLVQLPAADGGDILGPSLNGGAIAVNNGVPAGYADNQPSDWQDNMWALGVASGGGVGHFSAFTPQGFWRADPGDITAPLLGGRSTVLSRNERRFFRGATGYAACVVPAGNVTPPPELSVMEFSYAGKSVRCPLDATPSALCPEAGHPEVAEIIDSALMDESAAEFIPDENNIVATLTVRAWRFGNRANGGAAELEQIDGEAEHAEVAIIGVGATLPNFGVTARELTSNISEAVYEVSIARQPTPGVVVSAWLDARPRLGREAKLLMKIRRAAPLRLKDLATLPRRAPDGFAPGATPPGAVRRDLWIGTDYAGPILTINALKSGVSLQIRAVSLDAKISLSDAASDGGRVLALTASLPDLSDNSGAFYRSQPDEAAWALLGISADGGAEITLALAAHPLPPRSIDMAVPDEVPGGALVADLMTNRAFMRLFPQLFFHAPQQLVEFTDANGSDSLLFSRKGGVIAAGAGLGAFVECLKVQIPDEPDGEVCSSPFHNGEAEINSPFLRAVRLRTRVQLGTWLPAQNTRESISLPPDADGLVHTLGGDDWEKLWEHYRESGDSVVSISASNTVTVTLNRQVSLIRPRQEDLPDLSASGLEVSVNENGMEVHIPADNTLKFGERRTIAFSLLIYESKPDGSKSPYLFWNVRLVMEGPPDPGAHAGNSAPTSIDAGGRFETNPLVLPRHRRYAMCGLFASGACLQKRPQANARAPNPPLKT